MLIGEVVGRLWASRQADGLGGQKMLLIRPLDGTAERIGGRRLVVAVDGLGAGPGERVIVARGSRVRDLTVGGAVPDKDVVIGIVDGFHIEDPAEDHTTNHGGAGGWAMILGRVIGQVWATRRDARLERSKLLVIRPYGWYQPAFDSRHIIAVDDLDAGVGDDVVVCLGQPARRSLGRDQSGQDAGDDFPVGAAVMGIVDRIDLDADAARPARGAPGIGRPLKLAPRAVR